jgi:hypothetical protein
LFDKLFDNRSVEPPVAMIEFLLKERLRRNKTRMWGDEPGPR